MSTHSKCSVATEPSCCSATPIAQIVTGTLALVGAAAMIWMIFAHHRACRQDPQVEIDQRINALEESLKQLQENFSEVAG